MDDSDEHDGDADSSVDHSEDWEEWREVHAKLIQAVRKSQEAVAIQKAQRRYWLEEIAWNLSEDGSLTSASAWKRPVPVTKTSSKKGALKSASAAGSYKRKKKDAASLESSDSRPAKKARKKKDEVDIVKKNKKARSASPAWQQEETPRTSPDAAEMSDRSYPPPDYHHHQQQQHVHHPHHQSWGDPSAAAGLQMMVRPFFCSALHSL